MTSLKNLAIALMLAGSITLPALAEQRGGPSSGGWRPQSPSMQSSDMRSPDDSSPCPGHPCGW